MRGSARDPDRSIGCSRSLRHGNLYLSFVCYECTRYGIEKRGSARTVGTDIRCKITGLKMQRNRKKV